MSLALTLWLVDQQKNLERKLAREEITEQEFEEEMRGLADEYEAKEEDYNRGKERF